MPLLLPSDFPNTPIEEIGPLLDTLPARPVVAWIPPCTDADENRFSAAKEKLIAFGFGRVEHCDIDQKPDHELIAKLPEFDAVYLSGGNPIRIEANIARHNPT